MFSAIDTPRLRLRRFAAADVAAFVAYRNEPAVARYQSWDSIATPEAVAMIASHSAGEPGAPGVWFQFAVTRLPELELIGDCGLHVDAADPRLGEVGISFAAAHQGQGLASEALSAILGFSFETLGLHRVHAVVDRRNEAAVRLFRKAGLRQEALFLQHTWFKGSWCDEYVFAILSSEWRQRDPASV
jgi:aminoglycoside 6'-N-acetyltransferase